MVIIEKWSRQGFRWGFRIGWIISSGFHPTARRQCWRSKGELTSRFWRNGTHLLKVHHPRGRPSSLRRAGPLFASAPWLRHTVTVNWPKLLTSTNPWSPLHFHPKKRRASPRRGILRTTTLPLTTMDTTSRVPSSPSSPACWSRPSRPFSNTTSSSTTHSRSIYFSFSSADLLCVVPGPRLKDGKPRVKWTRSSGIRSWIPLGMTRSHFTSTVCSIQKFKVQKWKSKLRKL